MNFNRILFAGRCTRDPDLKHLSNQSAVAEWGMACNRRFKSATGEDREDVVFVDVAAFGKLGEFVATHFQKGKPMFVEGRLHFSSWEHRQSGQKRSKLSIIAERCEFVGPPDGGAAAAPSGQMATADGSHFTVDDIPF